MASLIAVKNKIKQHGIINLESLANNFQEPAENLLPLLDTLIAKGYIEERKGQKCGTTCHKCPAKSMRIYYWLDTA